MIQTAQEQWMVAIYDTHTAHIPDRQTIAWSRT